MTKFAYLQRMSDECLEKALREKDCYLKTFWANASKGFTEKALKMSVEEGSKEIGFNAD